MNSFKELKGARWHLVWVRQGKASEHNVRWAKCNVVHAQSIHLAARFAIKRNTIEDEPCRHTAASFTSSLAALGAIDSIHLNN